MLALHIERSDLHVKKEDNIEKDLISMFAIDYASWSNINIELSYGHFLIDNYVLCLTLVIYMGHW